MKFFSKPDEYKLRDQDNLRMELMQARDAFQAVVLEAEKTKAELDEYKALLRESVGVMFEMTHLPPPCQNELIEDLTERYQILYEKTNPKKPLLF
jgi:hypothetical protein